MYNWSLAVVDEVVDSATYDMVTEVVAGGQPKFDRLSTHTRFIELSS